VTRVRFVRIAAGWLGFLFDCGKRATLEKKTCQLQVVSVLHPDGRASVTSVTGSAFIFIFPPGDVRGTGAIGSVDAFLKI